MKISAAVSGSVALSLMKLTTRRPVISSIAFLASGFHQGLVLAGAG